MPDSLMRRTINTILPKKGSFWRIPVGSDSDKFYDWLADCWEIIREFLSTLAFIRNPRKTTFLNDLEREYGVLTNPHLSESARRSQLAPIVYDHDSNGSIDDLQNALQSAGFNVQVHSNSPAVDPAIFLTQAFQMVANGGAAFAGNQDAFAGILGGELLVNGDLFTTDKIVSSVAGNMFAGAGQTAGEYTDLIRTPITYDIPTDPNSWPFVFFVGGDATRNGSGELIAIESAGIPSEQEQAFKRIVLKYKPIHSWAALIVTYV